MTFLRPSDRFGLVSMSFVGQHRYMYDAIGANAIDLLRFKPQMVLGYDTGSDTIKWSQGDWNLFPSIPHVHTDQAGFGAPVHSATVMDIEPGAYRPEDVPGWMAKCTAPRPTAYVDRVDCHAILANGYMGDIMLAWPGWAGEPLPGNRAGQVVAVQHVFQGDFDITTVLDPWWPNKKPAEEKEMLSGFISPLASDFIPFPAGSFKQIMLYHDFTSGPVTIRVAIHSQHLKYSQIEDPFTITDNSPQVIAFTASDVDGVSLVNESYTEIVGWTLS